MGCSFATREDVAMDGKKICIHRGLTPFPAMPMESMTGCVPTGDGLQEHPDLMLALRLALRGWKVPPLIVYRVSLSYASRILFSTQDSHVLNSSAS